MKFNLNKMKRKVNVKAVSAFTINGEGGNKAGLVFNSIRLTQKQKQEVAAKSSFSETAFISHSKIADFKLEFFTSVKQIPHCGHATIATFSYLKNQGIIIDNYSSKETIDGVRKIYFDGEIAYMEQQSGKLNNNVNHNEILAALNINSDYLNSDPVIVNTGNAFLIVELKSIDDLKNIRPNLELIKELSEKYDIIGFYLFVKTINNNYIATTRMFAPRYGIKEEAATGSAAGPLAWLLYTQTPKNLSKFIIRQGEFMFPPSPSNLHIMITDEKKVTTLFVGGSGTYISNKEIFLSKN